MRCALRLLLLGFLLTAIRPEAVQAQSQRDSLQVDIVFKTRVEPREGYNWCTSLAIGVHADPVGNGDDYDYSYSYSPIYRDKVPDWTGLQDDIPGQRITYFAGYATGGDGGPDGEGCGPLFERHKAAWAGFLVWAYFAKQPNEPPVALFTAKPSEEVFFKVDFDGSASFDPDDPGVTYSGDVSLLRRGAAAAAARAGSPLPPQRAGSSTGSSAGSSAGAQGTEEDSVPVSFTPFVSESRSGGYLNCGYALVGSHADPVGNGRDTDYRYPFNWDPGSTYFDGYVGRTPPEWTGMAEDIPGQRITFYASWAASWGPDTEGAKCDANWGSGYTVDDQNAYFAKLPNKPPVAAFTTQAGADAFYQAHYDGSASSDSDGQVISYAWDFGDASSGSGATTSHTYAERGTYTVTLTVTDDEGAQGSLSKEVLAEGPDLRFAVSVLPMPGQERIQVSDTARVRITVTNTGDVRLEKVRLPGGEADITVTPGDEEDDEAPLAFLKAERGEIAALEVGQADTLVYLMKAVHADEKASVRVGAVAAQAIHPQTGAAHAYDETEETCPVDGAGKRGGAFVQTADNAPCTQVPIDPAPFIVNATGNAPLDPAIDPDEDGCSTGRSIVREGKTEPECTLRAAIEGAARSKEARIAIEFDIPGGSGGVHKIALTGAALPALAKTVTLAGPSKDGTPVEVAGSGLGGAVAFDLQGDSSAVARLAFYGFPGTVLALGGQGSSVTGSLIGSDWARSYASAAASGALRNGGTAVVVTGDGARVGGPGGAGNLIVGSNVGIHVDGAWDVEVVGNVVGNLEMPHAEDGIRLVGARRAQVGTAQAGNEIRFNLGYGIHLDAASAEVRLQGNTIERSRKDGVLAEVDTPGAAPVLIGGEEAGQGNTITRSVGAGIRITGGGTGTSLRVVGNRLRANEAVGVLVEGGGGVHIGGPTAEAGTGAGNDVEDGIRLVPGTGVRVMGNRIARLDPETGRSAKGGEALYASGANNRVGGETPAEGNVVYGVPVLTEGDPDDGELDEEGAGVGIRDAGQGTTLQNNQVGLDGPLHTGVILQGTGARVLENTISGNTHVGLSVRGATAAIEGNFIGTTETGGSALPNGGPGIEVFAATTIGGSKADEACERPCNVISGNEGPGILVRKQATGTRILGNMIGVSKNGLSAVGNGESGIVALADGVVVGGVNDVELGSCRGPCNVVAANGEDGIRNFEARKDETLYTGTTGWQVTGTEGADALVVLGNFIGATVPGGAGTGTGNAGHGVALGGLGSGSEIGRASTGGGNLIAGNGHAGVAVLAGSKKHVFNSVGNTWMGGQGNRIRGNIIYGNGDVAIDLATTPFVPGGDGWSLFDDRAEAAYRPNRMLPWPYLVESGEGGGGAKDLLVLWQGDPATEAGSYLLDVYAAASCRGATAEAQNYLVSRTLAFPVGGGANVEAVRVEVPFVASRPYYVATLTDSQGNTSELGNCRRGGERPERALSTLTPERQALVNGLLLTLREEGAGKTAGGATGQAADQTVMVLRSAQTPGGDTFEASAAQTPGGTSVVPAQTRGAFWEVLWVEAAAAPRYDACLPTDGAGPVEELVVLSRGAASEGRWRPHDTRVEVVGSAAYACASGLTAQQLTLGSGGAPALAAPALLLPSDGAEGVDLKTAELAWERVPGAATYTVEIATDAGFASVLLRADGVTASGAPARYVPAGLLRSQQHYWRVRAVTGTGEAGPWSAVRRFATGATSVAAEEEGLPEQYALEAPYPNPFNPQTTVAFTLPAASEVRLAVYDLLGREVAVLADGTRAAGRHRVVFEAGVLPTGVYLVRLQAGAFSQTRRAMLLK